MSEKARKQSGVGKGWSGDQGGIILLTTLRAATVSWLIFGAWRGAEYLSALPPGPFLRFWHLDPLGRGLPALGPLLHTVGPLDGRGRLRGWPTAPSVPPACHVLAAHRPGVAQGVHGAASVTGHWPWGPRRQEKEPNQRLGLG